MSWDSRVDDFDWEEFEEQQLVEHLKEECEELPGWCWYCDAEHMIRRYDEEAWTLYQVFLEEEARQQALVEEMAVD